MVGAEMVGAEVSENQMKGLDMQMCLLTVLATGKMTEGGNHQGGNALDSCKYI